MGQDDAAAPDRQVYCLDIEASSLKPGSYPIEVAVTNIATAETQSWLIRPTIEWLKYGHWSDQAQAVHGISKSDLIKGGLPVRQVARELAARVSEAVILSDEPKYDQDWLSKLFLAANKPKIAPILADFHTYAQTLASRNHDEPSKALWSAKSTAGQYIPQRHRAEPDARRNAEILRLLANHS